MSAPESTKQRALRIDLDHHKRPEPLSQAKWVLAVLAALASVAYAGYLCYPGSPGVAQLSPGHVADVHAGLNHRCAECHRDFQAIHGDALAMRNATYDDASETWSADTACLKCHAAPHHHDIPKESPLQAETCGACHQDHQGIDASLVRMDDNHCTRCHANLGNVDTATKFDKQVTAFFTQHPDFQSLKRPDEGNIAFSHAIHMAEGLPRETEGRALSKYEDIDVEYLKRAVPAYKGEPGDVQLACSSCHEPQSSDDRQAFTGTGGLTRVSAHMAPIRFDQHCAACHPLTVGPGEKSQVPHGLQGSELEQAIAGLGSSNSKSSGGTREHFERLLAKPREELIAEELKNSDASSMMDVKQRAAATCGKCHANQDPFAGQVQSNIPTFWFQHARFDHSPHRAMDCKECHEKGTTAQNSNEVMIPNRETCVKCHGATSVEAGLKLPVARSDCAECHTYHGGELTAKELHPRIGSATMSPSRTTSNKAGTNP